MLTPKIAYRSTFKRMAQVINRRTTDHCFRLWIQIENIGRPFFSFAIEGKSIRFFRSVHMEVKVLC